MVELNNGIFAHVDAGLNTSFEKAMEHISDRHRKISAHLDLALDKFEEICMDDDPETIENVRNFILGTIEAMNHYEQWLKSHTQT